MKKKIIGAPLPLGKVTIEVTQQDLLKVANVSDFAARMIFMTWKEAYDKTFTWNSDLGRRQDNDRLSAVVNDIDRLVLSLPDTVAKTYVKLQQDYLDELEKFKLPKV